jgi:hypothetical protein
MNDEKNPLSGSEREDFDKAREAVLPLFRESIREHAQNLSPSLQDSLASIGASMLARQALKQQTELPKEEIDPENNENLQLSFWGEEYRAAPNAVFRSSLFPVLSTHQKENRRFLNKEDIFCVSGLKIVFTGQQFDQSDLDVYLELLKIAQPFPLGTPIKFSAYYLLKSLGLPTGGSNHTRLHDVLVRLRGGTVDITDHGKKYFGGLIEGGFRDEATMNYELIINPKFAALFDFGMFSKLSLEIRRSLGRNPTAKSLHAYYSSHTNPTAHKIETLANITGISGKNKKTTIIKAHKVMKDAQFLRDYEVQEDSIKADINHSPSQKRSIIKKETIKKVKKTDCKN